MAKRGKDPGEEIKELLLKMMDGEGTLNDDMKSYFNKLFGIEDIVEEPVESPIVVEEKEEESKNEE